MASLSDSQDPLPADTPTLDWLLEPDPENPGPRYFALTELLEKPPNDPEVIAARQDVMT